MPNTFKSNRPPTSISYMYQDARCSIGTWMNIIASGIVRPGKHFDARTITDGKIDTQQKAGCANYRRVYGKPLIHAVVGYYS